MASLTGQSISTTYDSLLKLTDNGPITSSFKEITDGLGNSSGVFLISTGQIKLGNYTTTTSFTGTAVGYLAFTSSGEIITTTVPGGISGSGTTNTIPKFTGASALGNSNITDSGTLISLGSNTTISSGSLGIGSSTLTAYNLRVAKNITGGTTARSIIVDGTVQSDVTSVAIGIGSAVSTQATAFTLGSLYSFYSAQGTLGAGSAITAQYGYYADSTLIGGVSNYGFYGNLASSSGRWNLYMNGTANNYLNGNLGIGIDIPNAKLEVYVNANSFQGSQITNISTGNIAGSVTNYYNGTVNQKFGAIGSGFTTYGVLAANDAFVYSVGGGISLAAEGSNSIKFGTGSSTPERMRITSTGSVLIGTTTDNSSGAKLQVSGSITYQNTFNRQSASYTLVLTDQNDIVEMNVAGANNLTVPPNSSVAFPIGTEIQVLQYGAGQTTIVAGAGVTLVSKSSHLKIANRWTGVTLVKVATNEWYVIGNLAA